MIIERKIVNDILKKILKENYKILSSESLNSFYGKYYYFLQTSYNIIVEIYNIFLSAKKNGDPKEFKLEFDKILNNQNYNEIFKYSIDLAEFDLDEIQKDLKNVEIINRNFKFIESLMSKKDDFFLNKTNAHITPEERFFQYIEPVMVNFNKKIVKDITEVKNKLAGTEETQTQTLSKSKNDPSVVKNVLILENLAYSFISEVENLFRKIQSISIDLSADNNKDWEGFNLLDSQNYSRQMIQFLRQQQQKERSNSPAAANIQDIFNRFLRKHKEKIQKYAHFNVTNGQPKDKTVFNKEQFLTALRDPKKVNSSDYSAKKALIITTSLDNVDEKNKQIKNTLQGLSKLLWDQNNNQYHEDLYVKKIFASMSRVKNLYKSRLNKVITIIEKENDLSKMLFEMGKECDLFLKFLSFNKLDIRASLLQMMTNNNISVDSSKLFDQYKNNVNDKMTKSLIYWNLFKNLGWISAAEPPEWMYGNVVSDAKNVPAANLPVTIGKIATSGTP
jgi:hypothetical protein